MVAEPFPMVGEPLQSHAQVWRLPVGSRIGYEGEGAGSTLHSDGLWYDEHAGPEDGNGTPSDEWIVPDDNWVVQHLPVLTAQDLLALPVGSLVFWPQAGARGVYRKFTNEVSIHQLQFRPIPDGRTSNRNCLMDGCVLVWRPDAELRRGLVLRGEDDMNRCPVGTVLQDINAPRSVTLTEQGWRWITGQEQEALDGEWAITELGDGPIPGLAQPEPVPAPQAPPEPVRIEPAAVLPGMYLAVDDTTRVFILTRTGDRYSALVLVAGTRPRIDTRRTFRQRAYRLLEQDSDLVTALATLLGGNPEQAQAVERAQTEAVAAACADVNRSWTQRVERFNAAFWDVVDNSHLDDDIADDLAQHHSTILTPRTSEYEVTLTVTGTHKRTVRAHDAGAAVEDAIEDTGFHDGLSTTLYQEDFYVTSVEGDAEEL